MLKQKVTILLIVLCISSVSGFFTVICHGSDGHISVEPVVHNHCECPETSETEKNSDFTGPVIGLATDDGHCKDLPATSNLIFAIQKKVKSSAYKAFTTKYFLQSISTQTTSSLGHSPARSDESASFFAPLRTVILLA